jgi:predicted NBD/HSP70 family sugar kinase
VFEPEPCSAYVLAKDYRVERTVAALVVLGGVVKARTERQHRRHSFGPGRGVQQLRTMAKSLLRSAPARGFWVGTAVAVPGVVRHRDGLVHFAPNLGWVEAPLGEALGEALGLGRPVIIGNDADFGAVAEHARGAAVGVQNLVYLAGEVGVGGGIILDGRPLAGAGGYAGEVGHMRVNPRGRVCRCGAVGCWETEIGEDVLLDAVDGAQDVQDVIAAAQGGHRRAQAALRRVGTWLGVGVGNLVNVVNPEMVVMGGPLREVFAYTQDRVEAELAHALTAPRSQVRLVPAGLGHDSALIGAAETAFGDLLADPLGALSRARRTG